MSNYAGISYILNEFQLNFERVGPYRVNTKKSMTRLKIEFKFCCCRCCSCNKIWYIFVMEKSAQAYKYTNRHTYTNIICNIICADSRRSNVCIHTFHFSHYLFAESMKILCYSVCLVRLLWFIVRCFALEFWVTLNDWLICISSHKCFSLSLSLPIGSDLELES